MVDVGQLVSTNGLKNPKIRMSGVVSHYIGGNPVTFEYGYIYHDEGVNGYIKLAYCHSDEYIPAETEHVAEILESGVSVYTELQKRGIAYAKTRPERKKPGTKRLL